MSEPLVDATTPSFLLDGELPRLGDTATPATPSTRPGPAGPSPTLAAPGASPVIGSPSMPDLPVLLTTPAVTMPPPVAAAPAPSPAPSAPVGLPSAPVDLPTLPSVAPTVRRDDVAAAAPEESSPVSDAVATEHPMAHLMPQKSAPSEASKRAAELRAAKKAKSRKIKIGVAIGALAVAAIAGPPLGRWVLDALDEAGNTSTEVGD